MTYEQTQPQHQLSTGFITKSFLHILCSTFSTSFDQNKGAVAKENGTISNNYFVSCDYFVEMLVESSTQIRKRKKRLTTLLTVCCLSVIGTKLLLE